jgi:RimJ/RimL family protein N-acetyltransferase
MEKQVVVIRSPQILLRRTENTDLDFVLYLESHEDNAPYIVKWSRDEHYAACLDRNMEHLIIETIPEGQRIGYIILAGLLDKNDSIELKRIVISTKNKGYGKEALHLIKKLCFEQLKAHRLWLDVKEQNKRARHVYTSVGFVEEGILRECLKTEEKYESLIVMSILANEYFNENF